jgi:Reverse transcriptase (RNA-dependent DNA polymerase)
LLDYCDAWDWNRHLTHQESVEKNNLTMEVDRLKNNLIPPNELIGYGMLLDPDAFFEELIRYTKNAAFKLQKNSGIKDKQAKEKIISDLLSLRKRHLENDEKIRNLESELDLITSRDVADRVQNYLKSDILNREKMTPKFLTLARAMQDDSIKLICNDEGVPFENDEDWSAHIVDFYKELYKVPDKYLDLNSAGSVSRFLGPEICSNPNVLRMKLDQEEADRLDEPISLAELDEALRTSNLKSAPGIDGVSNKFISKIWHLVRVHLKNYVACCFRKGRLTETFRVACIKLKNWRPISLLSCYYKIVSRVINTRLGTVIDKITGRSQKAYNRNRNIHDVIININSVINYCHENKISGAIVSIDQKKAFDSI